MTETANKKRWYVLQAFSGFEARVATTLREYIKLHNMEDQFGEVLVPTEEVVENVAGKRRKSERKYFPGYVLVQMEMNDDTWHLVRSVPRVMGFIGGTPDKPAPISNREADIILNRLEQNSDKQTFGVDGVLMIKEVLTKEEIEYWVNLLIEKNIRI